MKIKKSMMLHIIFGSFLAVVCVPSINGESNNIVKCSDFNLSNSIKSNEIEEPEGCSFMYVGKNVSETKYPMIARTGDTTNAMTYTTIKVTKGNEYANKTFETWHGFTWQMPETTYKFIGFPRSSVMNRGKHWEVSTINEKGFGVSATLTCYSNDNALKYDNYVKTGIDEDGIAALLGATCSTAKEGIEYLANVINEKGSAESNALMTIDKNEAWYMEIYNGHQYCAVKLPDDKCCTIGNEFMLDTLKAFNDEDIITSPDLLNNPKDNGYAVFDDGIQDLKHLNLFKTYARELSDDPEKKVLIDASHMRTWRGINLFAIDEEQKDYASTTKYNSFFTPKRVIGKKDIYTYMRDRFENLIENKDSKYDIFREYLKEGKLRYVGSETSYQVHVITPAVSIKNELGNFDIPTEMSMDMWFALGNAPFSPFLPINNSMEKFPDIYVNTPEQYVENNNIANYHFRRLNGLANINEEKYGVPIKKFWSHIESNFDQEYLICWNKIKEYLNSGETIKPKQIIQNLFCEIMEKALKYVDELYDDLSFKYLNDQKSFGYNPPIFVPKIDIKEYATLFGYSYEIKDSNITLKKDNETINIKLSDGTALAAGEISINNEPTEDFYTRLVNGTTYGDEDKLYKLLSKDGTVAPLVEPNKYLNKVEPSCWPWLIPFISLVGVATILICVFTYLDKKKKKAN